MLKLVHKIEKEKKNCPTDFMRMHLPLYPMHIKIQQKKSNSHQFYEHRYNITHKNTCKSNNISKKFTVIKLLSLELQKSSKEEIHKCTIYINKLKGKTT